jgi:hypothetical protein
VEWRVAQGVGVIIEALNHGAKQTMAVLCTMTVLIYSYAILGMTFYGQIADAGDPQQYNLLGPRTNFQNFGNAINLLIRCASGESYNGIMHELHDCDAALQGSDRCRWAWTSYVFMVRVKMPPVWTMLLCRYLVCMDGVALGHRPAHPGQAETGQPVGLLTTERARENERQRLCMCVCERERNVPVV